MWRGLQNLHWLLTYRVVFPHAVFWRAVAALSVLVLLAPFETQLEEVGLSQVKLAVVGSLVVLVWFNMGNAKSFELEQDEASLLVFGATILMLAMPAAIIFAVSDRWVQHAVTAYYLLSASFSLTSSFFGEGELKSISFTFRHWRGGIVNAVRWMTVFAVAQGIVNELALRAFSPNEWIVVFALAPLFFHYLLNRTIIATHPYEDDDP